MSDLTRCDDQGVPCMIQSMYLTRGPIYYYFKATLFNGNKRDNSLASILPGKYKHEPLTEDEWDQASSIIERKVQAEFQRQG